MRIPISVTIDENIITATDNLRGDIPRSRVIENLINRALEPNDRKTPEVP